MASQRHMACKIPKEAQKITMKNPVTKKKTSKELSEMLMPAKKNKSKIPVPAARYKMAKALEKPALHTPKRKKRESIVEDLQQLNLDGAEMTVGVVAKGATEAMTTLSDGIEIGAEIGAGAGMTEAIGTGTEVATVKMTMSDGMELGATIRVCDKMAEAITTCTQVAIVDDPLIIVMATGVGDEIAIDSPVATVTEMAAGTEKASGFGIDIVSEIDVGSEVATVTEMAAGTEKAIGSGIDIVSEIDIAFQMDGAADTEVAIVEVPEGWRPTFVINIHREIQRFNTVLHNESFFDENVKKFGRYKNKKMQKAMKNVCSRMLDDRFLSEFSYSGQRGKKKFKIYTKVVELIIFATMEACENAGYEEVEKYFRTNYIKYADQRISE